MKKSKKGVLESPPRKRNTLESPPVTSAGKFKKDSPLAGYQWQPGTSGNPLGRPKTADLKAEVRAFADEEDAKIRKTRLRVWLEICDRRARQGSPKHLEMLLAYGWGRPSQAIEMDANISYAEILSRVRAARERAELAAAAPTNGHNTSQEVQAAPLLPDQDVSQAKEDDAEQPAPAKPKIRVEPWAN